MFYYNFNFPIEKEPSSARHDLIIQKCDCISMVASACSSCFFHFNLTNIVHPPLYSTYTCSYQTQFHNTYLVLSHKFTIQRELSKNVSVMWIRRFLFQCIFFIWSQPHLTRSSVCLVLHECCTALVPLCKL